MSWLDVPLFGFDLETTGTDPSKARIVTASLVEATTREARDWLVDPGVEIPEAATAVHGITTERARAEGEAPGQALRQINAALAAVAAAGGMIVGHNISYDLTVMHAESVRHGLDSLALVGGPAVIDTMVLDKQVDPYRKGKRTLVALAEAYGVTLTDAHDAHADALAAVEIALALGRRYPDVNTFEPKELHSMQIEWKRAQAASFQDYLRQKRDPQAVVNGEWPVTLS